MKKIICGVSACFFIFSFFHIASAQTASDYSYMPPFLVNARPPLVMLTMARDHRLYYEAYNDASDIDGDGKLDIRYKEEIDYYGYFDSYKLYRYDEGKKRFIPAEKTKDKKNKIKKQYWSGNFLNYITMTRMDCIRKVLYGGHRVIDIPQETVLRRAFIPQDAHSFGKEYTSKNTDGYDISDYTPYGPPAHGKRHFFASTTRESATSDPLLCVLQDVGNKKRIWNWVAKERVVVDDSLGKPDIFVVQVEVANKNMPESNCKLYPNGSYKPVGILQRYGESDKILFGLLTGSYDQNMAGGVLRKNIGTIRDEINTDSGEFTSANGIISTINKLRIYDFIYKAREKNSTGEYVYNDIYSYRGGWQTAGPMSAEGSSAFPDWGNPLAEMIYETTRYFAGEAKPTAEFTTKSKIDANLNLPRADWKNPLNATNYCSQPVMVAISDIFPSYDSDHLPGSAWAKPIDTSLPGLNVESGFREIARHEKINGNFFIGQASGRYDSSCNPKEISNTLGEVRGLCQEEPTKEGSYYSAAVTHYAATTDLNTHLGDSQNMISHMVAMSSPLPEIRVPIKGGEVALMPFAKTVRSTAHMNASEGAFQPTCTIVDFFVEDIAEDRSHGKFRVNFEDVEQGADHDMDFIVRYEYKIEGGELKVNLTHEYQSAGYVMHAGYVISGTTRDGVYLEITSRKDIDLQYYLDTPPDRDRPGRGNSTTMLDFKSERKFTPSDSPAALLLKNPLWYAAKWGGFTDFNNNGIPDLPSEWDKDGDGEPDNYVYVANPTRLEAQMEKTFAGILSRASSGTPASVSSAKSRDGEGAVYLSTLYPEYPDSVDPSTTLHWAGQVHALFVDKRGNLREDSNQNQKLDPKEDKIVYYPPPNENATNATYSGFFLIEDNGDSVISQEELTNSSEHLMDQRKIKYLWTSTQWLNHMSDADAIAQRSYNSTSQSRYIFTFADKDQNMIPDADEIQGFVWPPQYPAASPQAGLVNSKDFYAYLTLYAPNFEKTPKELQDLRQNNPTVFKDVLNTLAKRQVNFIRGKDANAENVSGHQISATRTRAYPDGHNKYTWRLGDIAYSTPIGVGRPTANYHLTYQDHTYANFLFRYANRRQMIYVGANDGMLHAFNGGFFNSTKNSFSLQHSTETPFALGQEVWAYVPYNLLPHLHWLTEPTYQGQSHVSYMDLPPLVFDARIFFDATGAPKDNSTYPDGWGTILVAGMRFGGGAIQVDMDKTDGKPFDNSTDRIMSSAYVIMDITNPEEAPRLLGEITMPRQGFTTCTPTVVPMTKANAKTAQENHWYLVFGSGPADANGNANPKHIEDAVSNQNGQLYVLDLKALVAEKKIITLDADGKFKEGGYTFATTEPASFISDPATVDWDLGGGNESGRFKTDAIYYGTVAGDIDHPKGAIYRMVTKNQMPPFRGGTVDWIGNATLIRTNQPIVALPSAAKDDTGRAWVYFGTGRLFNRSDIKAKQGKMAAYGIREPIDPISKAFLWKEVKIRDLFNSTKVTVKKGSCVDGAYSPNCIQLEGISSWEALLEAVASGDGWYHSMERPMERILGRPATTGGAVIFTAYTPSEDLCQHEGESHVWGFYYKTGTPYYIPIFQDTSTIFRKSVPLGRGLGSIPVVHKGEDGKSEIIINSSTGTTGKITIREPHPVRTGQIFWREN